jgi:hypothetical protein
MFISLKISDSAAKRRRKRPSRLIHTSKDLPPTKTPERSKFLDRSAEWFKRHGWR